IKNKLATDGLIFLTHEDKRGEKQPASIPSFVTADLHQRPNKAIILTLYPFCGASPMAMTGKIALTNPFD
ncbi:MAG: hypothetical protein WBR24_07875, partial [Desulfobacterales bacterium]